MATIVSSCGVAPVFPLHGTRRLSRPRQLGVETLKLEALKPSSNTTQRGVDWYGVDGKTKDFRIVQSSSDAGACIGRKKRIPGWKWTLEKTRIEILKKNSEDSHARDQRYVQCRRWVGSLKFLNFIFLFHSASFMNFYDLWLQDSTDECTASSMFICWTHIDFLVPRSHYYSAPQLTTATTGMKLKTIPRA